VAVANEEIQHEEESGDATADDGVKTRASRRIKRDLGKWTEGADAYRDYEKILVKVMAHPNAWPFNQPVDPVALNIPDYLDVVKQPMDLGTIKTQFVAGESTFSSSSSTPRAQTLGGSLMCVCVGEYEDGEELLADVGLVWGNCFLYNPPDHPICQWARDLSAYVKKLVDENEKKKKSESESDLQRKAFVYPSPISKKEVHTKVPTAAIIIVIVIIIIIIIIECSRSHSFEQIDRGRSWRTRLTGRIPNTKPRRRSGRRDICS
jgi:hypothetical protein